MRDEELVNRHPHVDLADFLSNMACMKPYGDFKQDVSSSVNERNECHEKEEGKSVPPGKLVVKHCSTGSICPKCFNDDNWIHFTQNTTFHGVKYVWLPGAVCLRRLLWSLLVTVCLGILSFQIVDRVIYYYDWPASLNVKVIYNTTLLFPTLTICNQNSFRASRAAKHGYYPLVTAMYGGKTTFSASDLDYFNASTLTLREMYACATHTKDDLIISCSWRGEECGPHNFTEVMTDHGVCYSFNLPDNNTDANLRVHAPGAENGLSLTLNVEQYEYMPGPHDAAGVKILVHDHKQFPKVQELGIALPTGTHSFVGMHLRTVKNLPKPHGECMSPDLHYFSEYSLENCEIDCFTTYISSVCQCRLFFMPHIEGYPKLCTLKDRYECYKNKASDIRQVLHDRCQCPVPCKFNNFDSIVSFAKTSIFAVDAFLSNVNRSDLKAKHQHARDITHRLQHSKAKLLHSLTADVSNRMQHLNAILDDLGSEINQQEMVLKDASKKLLWNWKWTNIYFQYQNYILQKNLVRARDAMDERTFSVLSYGVQEFVFTVETKIKDLVDPEINDSSARSVLFLMTKNQLNARIEIGHRTIQNYTHLITGFLNATSIFDYKYKNFLRRNSNLVLPKELLLKSFMRSKRNKEWSLRIGDIINDIIDCLKVYVSITKEVFYNRILNVTKMHQANVCFLSNIRLFLQAKSIFFHDVIEWPVHQLNNREETFLELRNDYLQIRDLTFVYLTNIFEHVQKIREAILKCLNREIESSQDYLMYGNISKLELAEHFTSKEIQSRVNDFRIIIDTVRSRDQDIFDNWNKLSLATQHIWNYTLSQTDMMRYWRYRNLTRYLRNYTEVAEEIAEGYSEYRDMIDVRCKFHNKDEEFLQSLGSLMEHMKEFQDTSHVDSTFVRDNLLRLDVFYRELNYQKLTQQKAYGVFALLCDIGGSMGLCIGASIISIFEIVDLIINRPASRRQLKTRRRFNGTNNNPARKHVLMHPEAR